MLLYRCPGNGVTFIKNDDGTVALEIANVTPDDAGEYTLRAKNPDGGSADSSATVTGKHREPKALGYMYPKNMLPNMFEEVEENLSASKKGRSKSFGTVRITVPKVLRYTFSTELER